MNLQREIHRPRGTKRKGGGQSGAVLACTHCGRQGAQEREGTIREKEKSLT